MAARKTKAMLEKDILLLENIVGCLIKKANELKIEKDYLFIKAEEYRIFYEYFIFQDEERAEKDFSGIKDKRNELYSLEYLININETKYTPYILFNN